MLSAYISVVLCRSDLAALLTTYGSEVWLHCRKGNCARAPDIVSVQRPAGLRDRLCNTAVEDEGPDDRKQNHHTFISFANKPRGIEQIQANTPKTCTK